MPIDLVFVTHESPASTVHGPREKYLDSPYPDGESWREAVTRVGRFLEDLPLRWAGRRVLVVGHVATRWGLEQFLHNRALADLIHEEFVWQEAWEYKLEPSSVRPP